MTPRDRYSTVAIVLHWLIAAAIVMQVSLAGRMEGPMTPTSFAVIQLHKSIGITILLLSLGRLAWRLMNPPPPLSPDMAKWERVLAHVVHVAFYVIMIGMPVTGWLMVSASKFAIPTLLYGVVPWPDIPGIAGLAPAAKDLARGIGSNGHDILGKLLYALVALHVGGALKHQFFDRNEPVLSRMFPGAKPGRWLEPRLLVILAGVIAVGAFGKIVTPPKAQVKAPPPAAAPVAGPEMVETPAPAVTTTTTTTVAPVVEPVVAEPVKWVTAAGSSSIAFATNWSDQAIEGSFDRWTADIAFSPDALDKSRVRVSIDIASVNTGDGQRDSSLTGDDWFSAGAHPKAVFTATRFEKTGADRYIAHGILEMRGVKKPVSLPFRLNIDGDRARVRGVTSLDRTAFGVGQGEWTSTDQIPGKVKVTISLTAKRG